MADDWVDVPAEAHTEGWADVPSAAHEGMSHTTPSRVVKEGAPIADRFVGGVESGLLEGNKLSAMFGNWLGGIPHSKEDLDLAVKIQNEHEAKVKAMAPSGLDAAHMLGEIADPLNYIGPAGAIKGATTGARILRGVIGGAQGGLLSPTQGTDIGNEKLKQATAGAVTGGVMGGAIPEMSPEAKLLVNEGVRLTPGQKAGPFIRRIEEGAQSVPVTGHFIRGAEKAARDDFNRAIYNRVLEPVGEKYETSGPIGNEGIASLRDKLGAAYDRAIRGTTFKVNLADQTPVGLTPDDLGDLHKILGLMTTERREQFNKIISQRFTERLSADGAMDAATFKEVEGELRGLARRYSRSDDLDQAHVGDAIDETVDLLRESLMRQNPTKAAELQAANRAYSRYVAAETGARRRLGSDGVMTPQDFLGGLSAMDASVRKNRFARGVLDMQDLARAGNKVLSSTLPNSGTADRLLLRDAALTSLGAGGAHYAGIPEGQIAEALMALFGSSVPYMRVRPNPYTANFGSKIAGAIDPALQRLVPGAGQVVAGATNGMTK